MKRMNANVKFKKENEVVRSMVKCTKKYSEATFIIYSINNHLFNVENSKLNYFKNFETRKFECIMRLPKYCNFSFFLYS